MEDVQKLLLELEHLRGVIDSLKLQQGILVSRFDSERGTEQRRHEGIDDDIEKLNKKIMDEIEKAEKQWNHIIFNRESGIAFLIDRLIEKDKKNDARKAQLVGLWIGVFLLIAKQVFDLITH